MVPGSPGTIEEAVALANGLPFPVTAECYVEALDRPLRIEATKSRTSLQKAEGERSPRVFLWSADSATALDRVRNPEFPRITRCFVCHDHEEDEPSVPGGRSSLALRPREASDTCPDDGDAHHPAPLMSCRAKARITRMCTSACVYL